MCIPNGTVSTKIYDKREDIVNFSFLDGDVSRRTSYCVDISQLIRFARASSNLSDFNCRHKTLIAKLLRRGCRYLNFVMSFRNIIALVDKYNVSLKTFLQQDISVPKFNGG